MAALKDREGGFDYGLLFATFLLMGLGAVMVYSATVYLDTTGAGAAATRGDGMFHLRRQLEHVGAGVMLLAATALIPFRWYRKLALPALVAGIILMILVLPLGERRLGAVRWFSLFGLSFQPGEFVKLAFVTWLAFSLSVKGHKVSVFSMGMAPHLLVAVLLILLYVAQPDLGSCVILGAVMTALCFVAGVPTKHLAGVSGIGLAGMTLMVVTSEERMGRIRAWLDPVSYWKGAGYQLFNSEVGIASGGLLGSGLGSGNQNISGYVPEAESDFIFSVVGEELGLLGMTLVLLAFIFILWRGLRLAYQVADPMARLMTLGITLLITLQGGINIGVATGLLPTKGLTMPFVSMGGSSMLAMSIAVGILLNISHSQPRQTGREQETLASAADVEVYVKERA